MNSLRSQHPAKIVLLRAVSGPRNRRRAQHLHERALAGGPVSSVSGIHACKQTTRIHGAEDEKRGGEAR